MSTEVTRVEVYPGKEALVGFDPGLTFECVDDCSWCCNHGVLLYEPDFRALAEHADLTEVTTTARGERFVPREDKDREDHVDDDGEACFFLDADGKCALQLEHDWKPTRCSVFPLHVSVADGELLVEVREDAREHCDGLGVSERRVIDNLAAFLPETLWAIEDPRTHKRLG